MILMALAYLQFSGDTAWLNTHYAKLRQFASYLIEFSLVPGIQLSTDDFQGKLINQTNLAIKGIIGLEAMAWLATTVGQSADARNYSTTAADYYRQVCGG